LIRLGLIAALAVAASASAQVVPVWDGQSLPITIEVLRDVEVKASERHADGSYWQERGFLYAGAEFHISKRERFRMIEALGEGGCRIEFQGSQYTLSSCPWVPGFTDQQSDIFKIVAFPNQ
jgi:hypothetical protein